MPSASLARAFEKKRSDVAGTKSMERSSRTGCGFAGLLVMCAIVRRYPSDLLHRNPGGTMRLIKQGISGTL